MRRGNGNMKVLSQLTGTMVVSDDFESFISTEQTSDILTENLTTGVATINVWGTLTQDWDMPGYATSMASLMDVVRAVEAEPLIHTVVYRIDSPGGVALAIDLLGKEVHNSSKKTVAIVAGMAASGAYWLASQCDEIVVTPLSQLGSIGAVRYFFPEDDPRVKYTSKNAPVKAAEGRTPEEVKEIKSRLDAVEEIMIAAIADGRGLDKSYIIENFGKGGMFLGQEAVEIGMADKLVSTYDDLLTEQGMAKNNDTIDVKGAGDGAVKLQAEIETLQTTISGQKEQISALTEKDELAQTYINRVKDLASISAPGREKLILEGIADVDSTSDSVLRAIAAEVMEIKVGDMAPLHYGDVSAKVTTKKDGAAKLWESNAEIRKEFVSEGTFTAFYEQNKGEF